jgi:lysophospholipase L1-like esterase
MKHASLCFAVLLLLVSFVQAEPASPNFERWEKEIAAIEKRDAEQKPAPGGIVFVGSSSIRLWDLKKSFPDLPVVNHGFGGSTVADSVHFVDRLVLKLKPKIVVFYAGDNDLVDGKDRPGKSPEEVHRDFQTFVKAVHAELPETKIIYVPIKPSPSRFKLFEKQKEANGLIRDEIAKDPKRLVYLNIVTPMLSEEGKPRPELFQKDMLHMNEAGYALWNERLRPLLK